RGDHRQDRLVERTADHFDASSGDEAPQSINVLRVPLIDPFHERPAGVQRDRKIVLLKNVQKGLICVLISLLEHAIEVANRLMVVQDEAKTNRIHGRYYRHKAKGFSL